MNDLYTKIILAARDDIEGWMNILFVVILAVFWALGGILKAKSKRFITEQDESSPDGTSHKRNVSSKFARQDLNQKIKQSSSTASNLRRQYRRQVEQLRRRISPRPIALS